MPKKKSLFLLILIVGLSIFFRFYNFRALFHYTLDEELWSYLTQRIVVYQDFPLVGGEISSTKIFTGPLFVYFHVPIFLLSHGYPLTGGYFWAAVGVLTTIALYFFAKRFLNKHVGLIASFLYAASFSMALYDRRSWNVSPMPIVSLLSAWLLFLALKGKKWALLGLSVVLSFGLQSHFSAMAPFLAVIFVWFKNKTFSWWHQPRQRKEVIIAIGLFLALNLGPLAIFDLRHNFWNLKAAKEFFSTIGQAKKESSNATVEGIGVNITNSLGSLVYLGRNIDVANEMSHCPVLVTTRPKPPLLAKVLGVAILGAMIILSLRHWSEPLAQFVLVLTLVNLTGLLVYRERVFTYHFTPIMPFFFLTGGLIIEKILKRGNLLFGLGLILAFLLLNIVSLLTATSKFGFLVKEKIVKTIISETGNEVLKVNFVPACEIDGYRYLFTFYGKPVTESRTDYTLGWLYPEELKLKATTQVQAFVLDPGFDPARYGLLEKFDKIAKKKMTTNDVKLFFYSLPK